MKKSHSKPCYGILVSDINYFTLIILNSTRLFF